VPQGFPRSELPSDPVVFHHSALGDRDAGTQRCYVERRTASHASPDRFSDVEPASGFPLDDWETLARALSEHALRHEVSAERDSGFGPRYEVDGPLTTPDGRGPLVRTVWQLDFGDVAPRLVTAYPVGVRR
jgi:Domain of unknown function (DUF6883)